MQTIMETYCWPCLKPQNCYLIPCLCLQWHRNRMHLFSSKFLKWNYKHDWENKVSHFDSWITHFANIADSPYYIIRSQRETIKPEAQEKCRPLKLIDIYSQLPNKLFGEMHASWATSTKNMNFEWNYELSKSWWDLGRKEQTSAATAAPKVWFRST